MAFLQEGYKNDELLFMDPSVVQMLRNVNTKVMEEQLNAMQGTYSPVPTLTCCKHSPKTDFSCVRPQTCPMLGRKPAIRAC